MRCMDKVLTKHMLRRGRPAHAGLLRLQRDRVQGAGRRRGAAGDRGAARLSGRGEAGRAGLGARDQVRARRRRRAGGADRRLQLRRPRAARAPRRGARAGGRPARGRRRRASAADRRGASRKQEYFFDFEARYEIGKTDFVCPADLPADVTARAQELAVAMYRLLGCYGFARVDMILADDGEPAGARGAGDPRA